MSRLIHSVFMLSAGALLAACASYDGRGLQPGASRVDDVTRTMGTPTAVYPEPEGEIREYARGPEGLHTFMAHFGRDGVLRRIDQVMAPEFFARVRAGMDAANVRALLGSPYYVTGFERRNEDVWDYRFRDLASTYIGRFHVVFDRSGGAVKSTLYTYEYYPDGPSTSKD